MERDQMRESILRRDVVNTNIPKPVCTLHDSSAPAKCNESDLLSLHPTIQLAVVSNNASFRTSIQSLIANTTNSTTIGTYNNLEHLESMLPAPCIIVVELLAEKQHDMLATVQRLESASASRFIFMAITANNYRTTIEECLYAGVRSIIPMARLTQCFEQGINALRSHNIFVTL